MQKVLPVNKIIIGVFIATLFVTGVLLFILLSKQRLSQSGESVMPTSTPKEQLTSINDTFLKGADKIVNRNTDMAFYFLQAVLVGAPIESQDGIMTGNFYLLSDKSKNIIHYKISPVNGKYPAGVFEKGFGTSSTWSFYDKDEFLKLAKNSAEVQMRTSFYLDDSGKTETQNIDGVLKQFASSTNGKIIVPDDFFLNVSSIGFTTK